MKSSMFSYSIGRFISNHTNVGFCTLKKLMGVSDLLIMETICSKSAMCVLPV